MKKVLVPISFSESSANSLRHANALFGEVKLTLLSTYPFQDFNRKFDFGTKSYDEGLRKKLAEFYHQHTNGSGVRPTYLTRTGKISEIAGQISNLYDLMVISRKPNHLKKDDFHRTKIFFIIQKARCPVLIMPVTDDIFTFEQCKKIWQIRLKEGDPRIVSTGISTLGLNPELMEEKSFQQKSFTSLLWHKIVTFSKYHDENLLKEIDKAHRAEKLDLIILSKREELSFVNFLDSDAIRFFHRFKIPLLVFPGK